MNVLIACEESQRVCCAFRSKGHNAFSCDILDCSGGHPEWHIKGDVLPLLNPYDFIDQYGQPQFGFCFTTCDGRLHELFGKWDLIIAHPPCTRLTNTFQRWLYYGSSERRSLLFSEQKKAIGFFMNFVCCDCDRVAIENPVGIMSSIYRKPDQIYNPYDFLGETECKRTCLWLKGLPLLIGSRSSPLPSSERTHFMFLGVVDGVQLSWNDSRVSSFRSKTPIGVALAMAEQWG